MKNDIFIIDFNRDSGGISRLSLVKDDTGMNFCREGRVLSTLKGFNFLSFEENEEGAVSVCDFLGVKAVTKYSFEDDCIFVRTVLTNQNSFPVYFSNGDICINMPINDTYESSAISMRERCHAHIWMGLENSYIRTERMGPVEHNIGIVFEKGSLVSYSQEDCIHSIRGYFSLNVEGFSLLENESYEISYKIFEHSGRDDFYKKALEKCDFVNVVSKNGYTFEVGQQVDIEILASTDIDVADVSLNNVTPVYCRIEKNRVLAFFTPTDVGEHELSFTINGKRGHAFFNVIPEINSFIKTRLDFIVDKQQCLDKRSPLYGAYLIYDNEEKRQYFNYTILDWNACRERMGMALSIAKWLQKNRDEKLRNSLDLFTEFLLRECVDEEMGTCYGNIGKDERFLRLYNSPWVALYFTELYHLTGEVRWARLVSKIVTYYYSVGGAKFYPNGIRFHSFYNALLDAGLTEDAKRLYQNFNEHIATIIKNDIIYPPHEVKFEQTIVSPAVTLLLDKYAICGEEFYLKEAKKHLRILRKFDGAQPHYRLNNISIRYWDDYWFGKHGIYGDVFPHYWSVLSGYAYHIFGTLQSDAQALEVARQCALNCLCNIYPDGSATCAYVYPEWLSGFMRFAELHPDQTRKSGYCRGAFADTFANDQDYALYFWMKMQEYYNNK